MNVNPDLICAEFLDLFLTVIQDKDALNHAVLASGCLKAHVLAHTMAKLSHDNSYIPLSSAAKAGLIDESSDFVSDKKDGSPQSFRAQQIDFFFDEIRINTLLDNLGLDKKKFNDVQKLSLAACCQEAMNRLLSGELRKLYDNMMFISDFALQVKVRDLIKNLAAMALAKVARELQFHEAGTSFSPELILIIERQRDVFRSDAKKNPGIDIPDEMMVAPVKLATAMLPASRRIALLDDLIPCLTINSKTYSKDERIEHQAKLDLLTIHATILSMTLENRWKVELQWFQEGEELSLGEQTIILPHTVSKILSIIEKTMSQKHKGSYFNALKTIQDIAGEYESDLYTWTRNSLPYVASSPAVKEFLQLVVATREGYLVKDIAKVEPKSETGLSIGTYLMGALNLGMCLFGSRTPDTRTEGAIHTPSIL